MFVFGDNLVRCTFICFLFIAIEVNRHESSFVAAQHLIAYLSQHGLNGQIHFLQINETTIEITSSLETTLQYPIQVWSWAVREFPVDYTDIEPSSRCGLEKLGREVLNFDETLGLLELPGNESSKWYREMQLIGDQGIWGRSLVLTDYYSNTRICATITIKDENIAEARFNSPIGGFVYFRWLPSTVNASGDALIYSNLYHTRKIKSNDAAVHSFFEHNWKIYVTDIFMNDHHRTEENCNFLQVVFDSQGSDNGLKVGDLGSRLGSIRISKDILHHTERVAFRDEKLILLPSDLSIPHRSLYLVLFDNLYPDKFLACAKIRNVEPLLYKSFINFGGIKGQITFLQRSKFEPTFLNFSFASTGANAYQVRRKFATDVSSFRIHNLPPAPHKIGQIDYCSSTGSMYNPNKLEKDTIPPPGFGTQDQYPLGDLSGKLQGRNRIYRNYSLPGTSSELSGTYWDTFLPLQGIHSLAHRSLVIHTYNRSYVDEIIELPWACSTISSYQKNGVSQTAMLTAEVLFYYPLVGRILFRQPAEEAWRDTTILIEYLIYADGSTLNDTFNHRWAIHSNAPGKDFYDWQNRCSSAGNVFNPFHVDWEDQSLNNYCKTHLPGVCHVGALHDRLDLLSIAGNKRNAEHISRLMFTDPNLPLSGKYSILGKSVVIYDDFGPKARGDRLACSVINGYHRRKAVAKEWFSNGYELFTKSKIEIVQQSEYDITNIEVTFNGLRDNSGYHIHMTPIESNLEFPCEATTLYGHWNPFKIDAKLSPPPKQGTSDQYEMGDLSGKFGTLDTLIHYEDAYNDTNLPLFGPNSIIGRSVIIHKKNNNIRWVCSTLLRGYSSKEASELHAIATFHNPNGYAYGYIRMSQLVFSDGGHSETVIEVNLKHSGKNNRNMTYNHNWQIFVNPVGIDAAVAATNSRCVAGGYVWNPYYTQLADPLNRDLYKQECGSDNPLRCYVGDLSSRLGPINIGVERVVFTDSNLPLGSPNGAIGRSIVIFGQDYSDERFSCANIEPDHDVIKYINLQKPPRFVAAQFLEDLRSVMGVPEWMLNVDARRTKELHEGSCVQMVIHFKGPIAHRLELDMSRLIATGRLDEPSLYIPGYVNLKRKKTISYRTCGSLDRGKSRRGKTSNALGVNFKISFLIHCFFILRFIS